ncbi:HD-GYP domain-containing protein [Evansella sp. AB-P1]|uniref:HD-GYP domain-containing protein n=1 Tax=Evansella sp. AB-P1 TaxID=3037653 RepID=UPI00241EAEC0|nr:HD-GYP domain-containing protein [Evansella sp. AB-P1]MDG5789750.1 HD-GYP domain-containing protein [Evansella sp. AB-P1]
MANTFNQWLNRPYLFQYGFFIFFFFSTSLNYILLLNNGNFFILYIITVILLGIGFYNRSTLFLTFFTLLVVLSRYLLIPSVDANFSTLVIYIITYLLITFISASLMRYAQKVKSSNIELTSALANALDSRDSYTWHHSENVSRISLQIAKKMNLSKNLCDKIRIGGLLHDIGKIGIPENILTKRAKLSDEEYDLIKTHPIIGHDIIKHVSTFHGSGVLDIVLYHHERYDGKGYPKGLKGKNIPLVARIVAVADSFDAMISKRVYRKEYDLEYTLNELKKNKGTQFDPEIVDIFLQSFDGDGSSDSFVYRNK